MVFVAGKKYNLPGGNLTGEELPFQTLSDNALGDAMDRGGGWLVGWLDELRGRGYIGKVVELLKGERIVVGLTEAGLSWAMETWRWIARGISLSLLWPYSEPDYEQLNECSSAMQCSHTFSLHVPKN